MNPISALATHHSSSSLPGWVWVAIVAFFLSWLVIAAWWSSKRRKARLAWCQSRGYTYASAGAIPEQLSQFKVFDHGHSRRVGENISGRYQGLAFSMFDYVYVTGAGKNRTTHHHAVVQWDDGGANLPMFSLTPEGWLSRIGNVFGGQDIDFDDDREFSRAFQLKGQDVESIRALFTPERRRRLAAHRATHVAIGYGQIFIWQSTGLPRAEDLDATLAGAAALRELFAQK